jgi:hypothetical protein
VLTLLAHDNQEQELPKLAVLEASGGFAGTWEACSQGVRLSMGV